jgi:hypothetical protein
VSAQGDEEDTLLVEPIELIIVSKFGVEDEMLWAGSRADASRT